MSVLLWLPISSLVIGAGVLFVDSVRPMLKRFQRGIIASYLIIVAGEVVTKQAQSGSQALTNLGLALELAGLIGMVSMIVLGRSQRQRVRSRTSRD